jgi:nitrogen fixation protein
VPVEVVEQNDMGRAIPNDLVVHIDALDLDEPGVRVAEGPVWAGAIIERRRGHGGGLSVGLAGSGRMVVG